MVVDTYYDLPRAPEGKAVRVTISVATFIPKPFTPFQWAPQDDGVRVNEKVALIKKSIHTAKSSSTTMIPKQAISRRS
jgi:radical SAM superfamily enzyme YgiQ (UPF0313 family)